MADYRLSAQVISRARGQSAVAAAAYRAGERLYDVRTERVADFSRKGGVLHREVRAPEGTDTALLNRETLWQTVEAGERRKDAQLAREVQLSLPHELELSAQRALVRGFVDEQFVARGMIADVAIHAPDKKGDARNVHCHIMLTLRQVEGDQFAAKKAREWNRPELLETWRERWAVHQNRALERAGHEARVDHRSFEQRGLDRESTQHLGPKASDMERRGKRSDIGEENRARTARNALRTAREKRAKVISFEVEREKRRFEAWAGAKRAERQSRKLDDAVELGRRHDLQKERLEQRQTAVYGEGERKAVRQIAELDKRLEITGYRKVVRDVLGRTLRDERERAMAEKTLAGIEGRKREMGGKLARRQNAEAEDEARKQAAKGRALERGIDKARRRREAGDWAPLPERERLASNTNSERGRNDTRPTTGHSEGSEASRDFGRRVQPEVAASDDAAQASVKRRLRQARQRSSRDRGRGH